MWTEGQRRIYRREGEGCPSDLPDVEWARLEPMIPPARPGGRPRKTDMRPVPAAHRLPLALPAARRVSATLGGVQHFREFQRDGVWEAIWAEQHMALRERTGRGPSPSAAVLDSQSVKTAEKGAAKMTRWVTMLARR
jgi:transposase